MEKEIEKIYEDENIVLINKPSGLVVNRSNTYKGRTLQDIIEDRYFSDKVGTDTNVMGVENDGVGSLSTDYVSRSGIVHRLDKDTSGILVIAKNVESFNFLQSQFKERKTYKEYSAVVHGEIEDEFVEINAPLARNPRKPLKIAVVSSGRPAMTKVEKEKVFKVGKNTYTLVRVFPKTGRTHQIRVHLSAIGHPVAGDSIYCSKNLLKDDIEVFNRMMLHSRFLGFLNPKTHKFQRFEAHLPKQFQV